MEKPRGKDKVKTTMKTGKALGKRNAPAEKDTKRESPTLQTLQSIEVKWDLKNCSIPSGMDPAVVIHNIKEALYYKGYFVNSITAFSCRNAFDETYARRLSSLKDLQMVWIEREPGDTRLGLADLAMKEDILAWSLARMPPSPLLVITSVQDYIPVLQLVMESGVELLLAYTRARSNEDLPNITESMDWHKLAQGQLSHADITGTRPSFPLRRDPPPPIPKLDTSLMVLWDVGSCPLPQSVALMKLRNNISEMLRDEYGYGSVFEMRAYKLPGKFPNKAELKKMEKGGITFISVDPPSPSKHKEPQQDYPDQVIKRQMYLWFLEKPQMPVLLISSDVRFGSFLTTLTALKLKVILATYDDCDEKLIGVVEQKLDWPLLAAGLQGNIMKKRKREEAKAMKKREREEAEAMKKRKREEDEEEDDGEEDEEEEDDGNIMKKLKREEAEAMKKRKREEDEEEDDGEEDEEEEDDG